MRRLAVAFIFIFSFVALATPGFAVVSLPNPGDTFDGLPVAVQYDDFFSYSTQLLTQFGFAGFNGAAGVGGLDVVLLTGAGGINNDPIAGGFVLEDPAPSANGGTSTFSNTWGQGDRPNGPVLVDDVLSYLHFNFGPNQHIPVFTFDLAEPGSAASRDLDLLAKFSVFDPNSNTEIASWALDNTINSNFDPASFITVQGEISLTGLSTTVYTANNTGSGKYDFLVFAPTMNLNNYAGQGYEFHIFSEMKNLDGSGEEAFISGAFAAPIDPSTPSTPEPATMLLVGSGLLAAGIRRLRKN